MNIGRNNLVAIGLLATLLACNNSKNAGTTDSVALDQPDGVMETEPANGSRDELMEFATEAAIGGMMEVELGNLAQKVGSNQRVKNFGAMMVRDHGRANKELTQLAVEKSIKLPDSVSGEHKEHIDELKKKRGIEFDKAYMKMMAEDHEDDVEKFEEAAKELSDPGLKAFAYKTLPVLRIHLDSAKSINKTVQVTLHPGDVSDGVERQTYP